MPKSVVNFDQFFNSARLVHSGLFMTTRPTPPSKYASAVRIKFGETPTFGVVTQSTTTTVLKYASFFLKKEAMT